MRSDKHIYARRRVCGIPLSGVLLVELRGLTLACWCPPKDGTSLTLADPEVWHGQVLLRLTAAGAEELAS